MEPLTELATMDTVLLDTAAFNLPTCAVLTVLASKFVSIEFR